MIFEESLSPVIEDIIALFATYGDEKYDENVSQTEHALQCALLATQKNASDELVVAALLHDIGHLLQLRGNKGNADFSQNDLHENLGAKFLSSTFGPKVTQPIELHVQAKRYLCSAIPSYQTELSEGSKRSLDLQGGPMSSAEITVFLQNEYFQLAVDLRTWDDLAKVENADSGQITDFVPLLERVATL
jgi:phosphonate degradation associated HDIG domain protein